MRIAVLSDIHSNLVALDAVLAHVGPVDALWHLGDIVGYGPDPDGVVGRLLERAAIGVRGNHDAAAIGGREIDWFNPEARAAIEWTRRAMSEATRSWLAALPDRRVLEGITLVHGSPRDPIREYISDRFVAEDNLAVLESRHALHGHTHVPVAWLDGGSRVSLLRVDDGSSLELGSTRALLNPGSVGQPRDGDPRAAYLLLDTDAGLVTWHRVPYEIAPVQAAIRAAGLPPRLADRLAVGA
jgi:diadenosine tetraphosphatase ApaH/serine/threonine PP2A family protein phosphatase